MNVGLTAKISKLEVHLKNQQAMLEDKKQELKYLQTPLCHFAKIPPDNRHYDKKEVLKEQAKKKSSTLEHVRTLTPASAKRRSTSLKRNYDRMEAKHRQLAEEEGNTFRRQHHGNKRHIKLAWSSDSSNATNKTQSFKDPFPQALKEGVTVKERHEEGVTVKDVKRKAKKMVRFVAEAVVLSAALDGELQLLQDCVSKVCAYCMSNSLLTGLRTHTYTAQTCTYTGQTLLVD